jgi:hypothetical protein
MSYEHDIFLSHARGSWADYVHYKFLPRLEAQLEAQVGSLSVSVDYQISLGRNGIRISNDEWLAPE